MWKTFYIKPNERGLLFKRSHFRGVLQPGLYRRSWMTRWRVETHDLNEAEASIDNLELLLQTHGQALNQHLHIVQTAHNEAALVRLGQSWMSLGPNQLRAYWRGFIEVEIHQFNLDESAALPLAFVERLRGKSLHGIRPVYISESEVGLLYIQKNFVQPLGAGEYAFWTYKQEVAVQKLDRLTPNPSFPLAEVLLDQHPDFVAEYCSVVSLTAEEVAIVRYQGKVIEVLAPTSRQLYWRSVDITIVNIGAAHKLPANLVTELVTGLTEVAMLSHKALYVLEVPAQHVGLMILDGTMQEPLSAGTHAWWTFGHSFKAESIDLRLQTLEVSGQEILSKDKVPLRVNLTAGYRVTNPVQAKAALADIREFLYKELQFALRSAVGTKSLDALLEDKGAIDNTISDHIRSKTTDYGIEVDSVGVKDIILPGEIKTILSKVVEAEKAAQANVVRRREETAATRSMLNTAKVMEDNPVALRLKELEILERIAEKIEHINVNGNLDSILTELINIKQP
ncbi:slipin family protein [filamentous cyanobacterium LEGE 11480]|uniref:Slipin family protein n=1 Tax=Romeriopsis navalis LEGE 11480 TaxID=2777977 RepID=A0A928Z1T1_9CYAN|nr:slipin family protein [Romeriopsis navalis]MBE9028337.1 slipin family protein [Romeriopsis navalis LEGE 11480]